MVVATTTFIIFWREESPFPKCQVRKKKTTQQQQNHPQQHENEHKTEHGQENRTTETLSPSTIEPSSKLLNQETTR